MTSKKGDSATVKVAVPKSGKRAIRHLGIFVRDKGVIHVDVPYGLRFGDEFELTYDNSSQEIVSLKVLRIPVPVNAEPGVVFKHRAPNGKFISVACPPGVNGDSELLIPWSDATSEHFVIQGQLAPPEEKKPMKPSVTQNNKQTNKSNASNTGRFAIADDDFRLAQVLSLTTLQSSQEQEMQKAVTASLSDHRRPDIQNGLNTVEAVLQQSLKDRSPEDLEFEQALKNSLAEYEKPQTMQYIQDVATSHKIQHSSAKQAENTGQYSNPEYDATEQHHSTDTDDMVEDAMMKRIAAISLEEAYRLASQQYAPFQQQNSKPNISAENTLPDQGFDLREGPDFDRSSPSEREKYNNSSGKPDIMYPEDERLAFLNSLPPDIRLEVLNQETLQEKALTGRIRF